MSNENYLLISWLVYSTSDHVDSNSEVNTARFRFEIFCKTERLRTMFIIWLSVVSLQAPNRPVVIMGEQCPRISQSEHVLYPLQT